MVNFAQAVREHWVHILIPLGFVIGCYLDRWNDARLSSFRNKSLLYKRLTKEDWKKSCCINCRSAVSLPVDLFEGVEAWGRSNMEIKADDEKEDIFV